MDDYCEDCESCNPDFDLGELRHVKYAEWETEILNAMESMLGIDNSNTINPQEEICNLARTLRSGRQEHGRVIYLLGFNHFLFLPSVVAEVKRYPRGTI